MTIQQPTQFDKLNSPDHSLSHRVIANDDSAPVQSLVVGPNGSTHIKEIITPTAIPNYGSIYTKVDDNLYFQNGAGLEKEVCLCDSYYGEMYLDNNSDVTIIETPDTPIMIRNFIAGSLSGFTFNAGSSGSITAYSDGTGKVNVASASHGLDTGDNISIRGTTNYNGVWTITKIDDNNFSIPDTWVSDNGASDWDEGSYLKVGASGTGKYSLVFSGSFSETSPAGSDVIGRAYINSSGCSKCTAIRKYSNNDYGNLPGTAILILSVDDKIYFTVESSGTNTVTCRYGNFNLHKL